MPPWGTFLSTPAEVHAFVRGVFDGFRHVKPRVNGGESHYYKGGYVLGYVLKTLLVLAVLYAGFT